MKKSMKKSNHTRPLETRVHWRRVWSRLDLSKVPKKKVPSEMCAERVRFSRAQASAKIPACPSSPPFYPFFLKKNQLLVEWKIEGKTIIVYLLNFSFNQKGSGRPSSPPFCSLFFIIFFISQLFDWVKIALRVVERERERNIYIYIYIIYI
jgi:hypothetical protein